MESVQLNWFFILSFAFAVMAPTLVTAVPLDPYWAERAKEGRRLQEYYYHPEPANVTREFTHHVVNSLKEIDLNDLELFNGTSRKLLGATKSKVKSTVSKVKNGATKVKSATKVKTGKVKSSKSTKYAGGCKAINPIDKCWRCRSDWHTDRKRLADCALGFGSRATGGKAGRFYTVTTPSDDDVQNPKPGTLRYAVTRTEPLWIIFERSMDIVLQQELIVTSHKTIDGRGVGVRILNGGSFVLQSVENVIIHNLKIRETIHTPGGMIRSSETHVGIRGASEGDGVSIFQSSNIWIDHVSFFNCADGMVDVIQGSTAVTISNCHFTDHNEVLLFGARDGYEPDKKMQVSLAFNHFGKRLIQRMPRVRHGLVHVVNNDYTHWEKYAIGGSSNPTIISQGNRYIANPNPQLAYAALITHRDYASEAEWKKWTWRSDGDIFLHGARFVESGDPDGCRKFAGEDHVVAQSGTMVTALTQFAGVLGCKKNQPC